MINTSLEKSKIFFVLVKNPGGDKREFYDVFAKQVIYRIHGGVLQANFRGACDECRTAHAKHIQLLTGGEEQPPY